MDELAATPEVEQVSAEYERAKNARIRWEGEESRLKWKLLDLLGYTEEDAKPQPVRVKAGTDALFEVRVGTWRGLNQKYLKETYPDIYAECEMSKATKTIKFT